MSVKVIPPQSRSKSKSSDSALSRFDLSIAYRLLISAYIRSVDKPQKAHESVSQTTSTNQS